MAFTSNRGMFPLSRMRRLRAHEFSRRLVRENSLSPADFIYPVFVQEGSNQREPIRNLLTSPSFAFSVIGCLQRYWK